MIKLSKRLQAIANFIKDGAKIADIGCDHALLDIYLVSTMPDIKVIAVDVREGALKQASSNVVKYDVKEKVDLRLGDGLEVISENEIDTVVISGLGGYKIVEILKNGNKLTNVNDIIVQPNVDYYHVRKSICSMGYFIADEVITKENDIIYVIIHFQKSKKEYNKLDYLCGPFLRTEKSSLFIEMINDEIKKKEILYDLIPHQYVVKRKQLKAVINDLKKTVK